MMAAVMATAREIAARNPLAVTGSKVMINYARDHSGKEALDYIALWQAGMFARSHMAEAFKAQQEKRTPRYPDLAPLKQGAVEPRSTARRSQCRHEIGQALDTAQTCRFREIDLVRRHQCCALLQRHRVVERVEQVMIVLDCDIGSAPIAALPNSFLERQCR